VIHHQLGDGYLIIAVVLYCRAEAVLLAGKLLAPAVCSRPQNEDLLQSQVWSISAVLAYNGDRCLWFNAVLVVASLTLTLLPRNLVANTSTEYAAYTCVNVHSTRVLVPVLHDAIDCRAYYVCA